MTPYYDKDGVTLHLGDCLEVLAGMDESSVDSVVTDPPYGLSEAPSMVEVLTAWIAGQPYRPRGRGFMGQEWDAFVPGPEVWRECLRVLKPGGHILTFGGTRTFDLVALGLRLAGFEVRDTLSWLYGTGFPKSLDVSKAIDAAAGAERTESVWYDRYKDGGTRQSQEVGSQHVALAPGANGNIRTLPATDTARCWQGWGTALKPAWEPVILARKPPAGTVAANVQTWGTGALNVDGCRIVMSQEDREFIERACRPNSAGQLHVGSVMNRPATPTVNVHAGGRWPANVVLDEEAAAALDAHSGHLRARGNRGASKGGGGMYGHGPTLNDFGAGDAGGASRFFYCAKASKAERGDGNNHPTVKPLMLMRWLVRLVTPLGGMVLDPFAGSGTTLLAARAEGVRSVGVEMEEAHCRIVTRRMVGAVGAEAETEPEDSKAPRQALLPL